MIDRGHANLAEGQPVCAAGQVQVSGGQILQIDNASGHYLPTGSNARQAALLGFEQAGFAISEESYVEKSWNSRTMAWEPVDDRT